MCWLFVEFFPTLFQLAMFFLCMAESWNYENYLSQISLPASFHFLLITVSSTAIAGRWWPLSSRCVWPVLGGGKPSPQGLGSPELLQRTGRSSFAPSIVRIIPTTAASGLKCSSSGRTLGCLLICFYFLFFPTFCKQFTALPSLCLKYLEVLSFPDTLLTDEKEIHLHS